MIRQPVESSNIRSVGYDEVSRKLEIEFRDGAVYQYAEVPGVVYLEMTRAKSVGKFFIANIRNQYQGERV